MTTRYLSGLKFVAKSHGKWREMADRHEIEKNRYGGNAKSIRSAVIDEPRVFVKQLVTADSRDKRKPVSWRTDLSVRGERFGHKQCLPVGVWVLSGELELGGAGAEILAAESPG